MYSFPYVFIFLKFDFHIVNPIRWDPLWWKRCVFFSFFLCINRGLPSYGGSILRDVALLGSMMHAYILDLRI